MKRALTFNKNVISKVILFTGWCIVSSVGVAAAEPTDSRLSLAARWVMISGGNNYSLKTEKGFNNIVELVRTGSRYGLNGIVVSIALNGRGINATYLKRLRHFKQLCDKNDVLIIPKIFSAGYGGGVLAHNRNLAPGQLVKNALFVVHDNKAYLQPEHKFTVQNGGFERFSNNKLHMAVFNDAPGKVSFQDTKVYRSGKSSLRFDLSKQPAHARVLKTLLLHPYRSYRISVWVKCQNLAKVFKMQLYAKRSMGKAAALITYSQPKVTGTMPWTKVTMAVNTQQYKQLQLYMGIWNGRHGKFWVDDLKVEEIGLLNVLRRPGTPITVRGESNGLLYKAGTDYQPIVDKRLNFKVDRSDIPLFILPNSRIKDGERLRVTYYHGIFAAVAAGLCMSEPETYRLWNDKAVAINKVLSPRAWLLSMDEIRAGGTCKACCDRKCSMAKILGQCLTKQFNMLRKLTPEAKICVWSDMLDPNHNGHDNYYLTGSTFYGSWKYIPQEMIMVPWAYGYAEKSTAHFSKAGFKFIVADYYDSDNLDRTKIWFKALKRHPGGVGMMYTTWNNKYKLLIPWLKMLQQENRK